MLRTYQMQWDGASRLRAVKQGVPNIFTASYDGGGLRTSKWDTWTGQHDYSWGPGGVVYDSNASTTYTPGLSQRTSGTDKFAHPDWLGSTRWMSTSSGLRLSRRLSSRRDAGSANRAGHQATAPLGVQAARASGHRRQREDGRIRPAWREYIRMDPQQATEKAERLLTLANVQRMRGNAAEAARLCQEALDAAPDNAVAHEMLGDLQTAQEQLDSAMEHYRRAFELEARPGREEKIGLLALRIDEQKRLGAGAAGFAMPSGPRKRLNPSLACMLSMLFPGLGQLYNGDYRKGFPLVAIWLVLSFNLYYVTMILFGPLFGRHGSGSVPAFAWLVGLVQVGVLIYSLIDASLSAVAINRGDAPGKKGGWEV